MAISTAVRNAGAVSTLTYTFDVAATAPPVFTLFADQAHTVVAVPAAPTVAVGDGRTFTATVPGTLAPATYYCRFVTQTQSGPSTDDDDTLILLPAGGTLAGSLVSLADMKVALEITSTTHDDELTQLLAAAADVIADLAGPAMPTAKTETHDGGDQDVCVRSWPILTVTSVTVRRGTAPPVVLTASTFTAPCDGYRVEPGAGVLVRTDASGADTTWEWGSRNIQVVFTAGRTTGLAALSQATKVLVDHWWRNRHGGTSTFALPPGEISPGMPASYGVPWAVKNIVNGAGLAHAPSLR